MTETSYYPPAAPPPVFGTPDTPGPVRVAIAAPAPQRRATVAFRAILAVPHLVVLEVLAIVALVVMVLGWFGALVLGRLPGFAAGYLSGYLRLSARVSAYLLLLTGQYPPFAFDDDAYPVRVAVGAGRLRRPAVLFRFVLSVPAAIVSALLGFGTLILVVFAGWPTALITGKLPGPLHQALASALRYNLRATGYLSLLTDTYPAGLFGDPPVAWYWVGDGQEAEWQLALSAGARRLVRLLLALGLLLMAGEGFGIGVTVNAAIQRNREISQLNTQVAEHNAAVARLNAAVTKSQAAYSQVTNAINQVTNANEAFEATANSPAADPSNCSTVTCFDESDIPVIHAFAAFGRALRATPIPASSLAIAKRLAADNATTEQDWITDSQSTTLTLPQSFEDKFNNDSTRFDNDYAALIKSLDQRAATVLAQTGPLDEQATALNNSGAALSTR
ncbi:MAG: DUF4389 domain-containing protein, partial [Trebonia sp.]